VGFKNLPYTCIGGSSENIFGDDVSPPKVEIRRIWLQWKSSGDEADYFIGGLCWEIEAYKCGHRRVKGRPNPVPLFPHLEK